MDRYVVGEWLARIQFVSAMLVFGWLVLDISLPSSRYQASLGVSQSGTFMGGVVDLLDDGLQVGVRQAVETGPLGQVAADPCMCSIGCISSSRCFVFDNARFFAHFRIPGLT